MVSIEYMAVSKRQKSLPTWNFILDKMSTVSGMYVGHILLWRKKSGEGGEGLFEEMGPFLSRLSVRSLSRSKYSEEEVGSKPFGHLGQESFRYWDWQV